MTTATIITFTLIYTLRSNWFFNAKTLQHQEKPVRQII